MRNISVRKYTFQLSLAFLFLVAAILFSSVAKAQNLGYEGPTGIFVTPLAATAASPANGFGKPVIATHVLAGGPAIGTFTTYSITEGYGKRAEFGYTREDHATTDSKNAFSGLWSEGQNIFHGKINVLPENYGKTKWVPALSVGGIVRTNDHYVFNNHAYNPGQANYNADVYLVGTKIVVVDKKLPVVLNGGVRGTNASLWGLGGNAPEWTPRAFGAVAFVLTGPKKSTVILGSEVAQQPQHVLSGSSSVLDIPTSIDYAIRVVPFAKQKLNIDAGVLQAAGRVGSPNLPGVDLQARARFAFGLSYGF